MLHGVENLRAIDEDDDEAASFTGPDVNIMVTDRYLVVYPVLESEK